MRTQLLLLVIVFIIGCEKAEQEQFLPTLTGEYTCSGSADIVSTRLFSRNSEITDNTLITSFANRINIFLPNTVILNTNNQSFPPYYFKIKFHSNTSATVSFFYRQLLIADSIKTLEAEVSQISNSLLLITTLDTNSVSNTTNPIGTHNFATHYSMLGVQQSPTCQTIYDYTGTPYQACHSKIRFPIFILNNQLKLPLVKNAIHCKHNGDVYTSFFDVWNYLNNSPGDSIPLFDSVISQTKYINLVKQ